MQLQSSAQHKGQISRCVGCSGLEGLCLYTDICGQSSASRQQYQRLITRHGLALEDVIEALLIL
jgi:hypothetical protein